MCILLIDENVDVGGGVRTILQSIVESDLTISYKYLNLTHEKFEIFTSPNLKIVTPFPLLKIHAKKNKLLLLISALVAYRNYADVKVVYVHQPTSLMVGVAIGTFLNIPVIYHCHGLSGPANISKLGILFKLALKKVKIIVAISNFVKSQIEKVTLESSIRLVYNWVPNYNSALPNRKRDVDFLFIGRLCKEKGLHTFVDSLVSISGDFRARIIGKKEDIKYANSQLSKIRADVRFKYLNILSHKEIIDILGNTRYLIVPSQWGEPFGLVVVEAMQRGAVVLARIDGAMPEIITHGVNGFLFQDTEDLHILLKNMDYYDLNLIRSNARKTVADRFDAEVQIEKVLCILREGFK